MCIGRNKYSNTLSREDKRKAQQFTELLKQALKTGTAEGAGMKITSIEFIPAQKQK